MCYGLTKDETPYKPKLTLNVLKFLKSYIIINIIGLRCTYWIIIRVAWSSQKIALIQVNLCHKHLSPTVWQKIVHWITSSIQENYKLRSCFVHKLNKNKIEFLYITWSELVVFLYWTRNSSYCGLVDADPKWFWQRFTCIIQWINFWRNRNFSAVLIGTSLCWF